MVLTVCGNVVVDADLTRLGAKCGNTGGCFNTREDYDGHPEKLESPCLQPKQIDSPEAESAKAQIKTSAIAVIGMAGSSLSPANAIGKILVEAEGQTKLSFEKDRAAESQHLKDQVRERDEKIEQLKSKELKIENFVLKITERVDELIARRAPGENSPLSTQEQMAALGDVELLIDIGVNANAIQANIHSSEARDKRYADRKN